MDQSCYTCHQYHLPSRICQELQEEKDVDECCGEWKETIHKDHPDDVVNCDVCGFVMEKWQKHLRCLDNLGGKIK